ncbi:hypothetical protein S83_035745 [Arachis hypogaea]
MEESSDFFVYFVINCLSGILFEIDKERRVAAHRRAVLRKESQVAEHSRRFRAIETRINQETSKMRKTIAEVSNLHRVKYVANLIVFIENLVAKF